METTDVNYYSVKKGKRLKAKDCPILSTFLFSRKNFYVVSRKGYYDFCIAKNRELVSLCRCLQKGTTVSEAMSRFRNGFLKNGINDEIIDDFINSPQKYLPKEKLAKKK